MSNILALHQAVRAGHGPSDHLRCLHASVPADSDLHFRCRCFCALHSKLKPRYAQHHRRFGSRRLRILLCHVQRGQLKRQPWCGRAVWLEAVDAQWRDGPHMFAFPRRDERKKHVHGESGAWARGRRPALLHAESPGPPASLPSYFPPTRGSMNRCKSFDRLGECSYSAPQRPWKAKRAPVCARRRRRW